jgi:hypothetical protein
MKKWLSYLLLSALLIAALPFSMARAEEAACSGKLTANGNQINVSLSVPQAAAEKITSLHFRLDVSISSGAMDEPAFQFAEAIQSEVKDSKVIKNNDSYIVDVILSGKKNQIIFPAGGQADIGTVSLRPSGSAYKISTKFTGITDENPAMEYVTDSGQSVIEVPLVNTEMITIERDSQDSSSSSGGGAPSATKEPDAQASPSAAPPSTATPDISPSPSPSIAPDATGKPGSFDKGEKPSLSAKAGKGSRVVTFKWNKISGADGYMIYSALGKSGNYKRIKTVSKPKTTTCNVTMAYASSYSFRMRAYKISDNGGKVYGQYSQVKKLTTAPVKVTGVKLKSSGKKMNLSWKKVKNTKGYQVYAGKKKNGKYTLVKTLKKGTTLKTSVKKNKKYKYIKVRAYVDNASKKHVYGNFSKVIKAK